MEGWSNFQWYRKQSEEGSRKASIDDSYREECDGIYSLSLKLVTGREPVEILFRADSCVLYFFLMRIWKASTEWISRHSNLLSHLITGILFTYLTMYPRFCLPELTPAFLITHLPSYLLISLSIPTLLCTKTSFLPAYVPYLHALPYSTLSTLPSSTTSCIIIHQSTHIAAFKPMHR